MNTQMPTLAPLTTSLNRPDECVAASMHEAAVRLHCAERALHDANCSQVDAWIAAAADQLHRAVVLYTQARTADQS
jgi:hypothetical protein